MKLIDYEQLPDGLSSEESEKLFWTWMVETADEDLKTSLSKLDLISDVQWHTYELPSRDVRQALSDWIGGVLVIHDVSPFEEQRLEILLGASYCYGLDKSLYERILASYTGESLAEFESNLKESEETTHIDPYWSMQQYVERKG